MTIERALKERRTVRKFIQKPLNNEQLIKYVEVARLAPSAANIQPLKYIVVKNEQICNKMFELIRFAQYLKTEYTVNYNQRPTAYIVVCADSFIRQSGYEMDVGAAVENIIMCASEDGVGSCWVGNFKRQEIEELLSIPDNLTIACVIALGYPAESPHVVKMEDDNIKYYLDSNNNICVPKREFADVLVKIV